ncbi:hypothetical protein [Helicobacter pullorum]|uniref:Uncharacterized protein n=1 Tax=Helicobacter pullorum TaxID=35818 RepID=A0A0N1EKE6_9HELI|nr:hypothetical protein [Helicobacter pullorum]KPH55465.1 hypothetical protein HPU229334_08450 [Helicobacter pullorum]
MTLEIAYNKKVDYDYIELHDVKAIYPHKERDNAKKKEYVVISKMEYTTLKAKAQALEKYLKQQTLFL